jgi:hypothetical protein
MGNKVRIETKTVPIGTVKINPDNPRRISGPAMDRLVKSLQEFPEMLAIREIVVDENMVALGGNMRTLALRKAGEKSCVAKVVSGLTDEQKRRFVITDNGSFGEWNFDLLASWDDLPIVDWGVGIPQVWTSPSAENVETTESQGLMAKNFEQGKGGEGSTEQQEQNQEKYPVTFILDQSEWEAWENVKEKLKLRDDKAAFMKLIGGKNA